MDKKYYQEIVKNSNSIILRFAIDGTILFINPYGYNFFGYSENELIGKKLIGTIINQKDSDGRNMERMLEKVINQPEKFKNNQNENITKGRRAVWISWTNCPIKNDKDEITEILSIGNDITRQRQYISSLKDAQRKFNELTNNLNECVWIKEESTKNNGEYSFASSAFEKIFGYSPKEFNNTLEKFITIVHQDDQFRVLNNHQKMFEKMFDMEYRATRADGQEVWIRSQSSLIKNKAGEVIKVVGITRDITRRKLAELEYLKMLENCPDVTIKK